MIHTELIKNKIPCINLSGGLLLGASHVRKVIAYARLAIDYNGARDDIEILKEVANVASNKFMAPMTRRRHLDTCPPEMKYKCNCPVISEEGYDISPMRYYGAESVAKAGDWAGIITQCNEKNRGGYPSIASKGASDLVYFVNHIAQFKDDALACVNTIISESVMPWLCHEEGLDIDDHLFAHIHPTLDRGRTHMRQEHHIGLADGIDRSRRRSISG
jgi:hypothetical protein